MHQQSQHGKPLTRRAKPVRGQMRSESLSHTVFSMRTRLPMNRQIRSKTVRSNGCKGIRRTTRTAWIPQRNGERPTRESPVSMHQQAVALKSVPGCAKARGASSNKTSPVTLGTMKLNGHVFHPFCYLCYSVFEGRHPLRNPIRQSVKNAN